MSHRKGPLLVLLALAMMLVATAGGASLPPRGRILADGLSAVKYLAKSNNYTHTGCDWEYGTYMIGLMALQKEVQDASLRTWARKFGNQFHWKLCSTQVYNPDNQVCGATYAELYATSPPSKRKPSWLSAIASQYELEMAGESPMLCHGKKITNSTWCWVDALFMTMSVWARMGAVTGDRRYFNEMHRNFEYAVSPSGFHLWSPEENLFFRDPPPANNPAGDGVFWSRGNGWAAGALVAALEHLPAADPMRAVYEAYLQKQAARLRQLQGQDGCWRVSLTDPAFNPTPESTGTAMFVYGMSYGVRTGLLDAETYVPTIEKAWSCLTSKALWPSGLVGYCQPVGWAPGKDVGPDSTSSFCVGQFAMAAAELSKLAPQ